MVLLLRKSFSCGEGFFWCLEGFHSKGSAWFLARIISLDIKTFPCGVPSASSISSHIPNFSEISVLHVVRSWKLYYWKWRRMRI